MRIKNLILIFVAISIMLQVCLVLADTPQASSTNNVEPNKIYEFFQNDLSNPLLKYLGMPESVTYQEFIITLILFIIVVLFIFDFTKDSEIISGGKATNLVIAIIIVLIGNYFGILYKIAVKLNTLTDAISFVKSYIFWIILAILALLIIFAPYLKKILKQTKNQEREEKDDERSRKRKMLEKIKDYETEVELKKYGAD